jgi:hypothetical protein
MPNTAPKTDRRWLLVLAALAALLSAGLAQRASEADAAKTADLFGKTKSVPKPLCPNKKNEAKCAGTGSVTGFGVSFDGKRGLYKAPSDGHIVAWSVDLSKPTRSQRDFFEETFKDPKFGTEPQAGISILKRKGKRSRYTLAKKSPTMPLDDSLGRKPIFTLDKPLKIQKGRIVALTMPTWAPLYTNRVSPAKNFWKASRKSDACSEEDVPKAKPHVRKGSTREYGCKLSGERILYWAFFVPTKDKKG